MLSASCIGQPKYKTIDKREITPSTKAALTLEKVRQLQQTVTTIYDKHCPLRRVRVPIGKPVITSPLIRKLQRAKKRAHGKKNPAWKAIAKILSHHQQVLRRKQTDEKVNNVVPGSKSWWHNIKDLCDSLNQNLKMPRLFAWTTHGSLFLTLRKN